MVRYYIVDDDMSVRKIIKNIIVQNQLGEVIGECDDGIQAEFAICECQPDIALIDLLLPGQDGVELIRKVRDRCPNTSFIMISQATKQPLITRAYEFGIEFFIRKPINVIEIISVINKVQENRKLKQLMAAIYQTTSQYTTVSTPSPQSGSPGGKNRMYKVFSDLGIIGEAGAKDLFEILQLVESRKKAGHDRAYQLAELYQDLSRRTEQDAKTIEQRIRRTVTKALQNVANIGVEDYYDEKFQNYSAALFDFKEVRTEMDYINKKSSYRGKINVKKFLEGLMYFASI